MHDGEDAPLVESGVEEYLHCDVRHVVVYSLSFVSSFSGDMVSRADGSSSSLVVVTSLLPTSVRVGTKARSIPATKSTLAADSKYEFSIGMSPSVSSGVAESQRPKSAGDKVGPRALRSLNIPFEHLDSPCHSLPHLSRADTTSRPRPQTNGPQWFERACWREPWPLHGTPPTP
nr:hypothetical protein Iba_chr06dCG10910 [Ipomoea batatas]